MTTFLSRETYYSWCCQDGAKMQCACPRVNYCNHDCMRVGRAEHRLVCPASKPTTNELKPGALVRISGLQSAVGKTMNQQLAEVL